MGIIEDIDAKITRIEDLLKAEKLAIADIQTQLAVSVSPAQLQAFEARLDAILAEIEALII